MIPEARHTKITISVYFVSSGKTGTSSLPVAPLAPMISAFLLLGVFIMCSRNNVALSTGKMYNEYKEAAENKRSRIFNQGRIRLQKLLMQPSCHPGISKRHNRRKRLSSHLYPSY